MDQSLQPAPTPNRRTVIRTAAWAVPAIAVATSAPAFAVSGDAPQVPPRNGAGGTVNLNLSAGRNALEGDAIVGYNLIAQSSPIAIPALTAHVTISGDWAGPNALFSDVALAPFTLNQRVTTSTGLVWVVSALTPTAITFVSVPVQLPGATTRIDSPQIYVDGSTGTPSGVANLAMSISGIGAITSNPSNFATW